MYSARQPARRLYHKVTKYTIKEGQAVMGYKAEYEEGLHNAMLRAKIEYVAKTKQPNGCLGNDIEELQYHKDFLELKKYLKYLGFRVVREYEVDGGKWMEINKNIQVSEDGFVTSYKREKRRASL
jgi:hypothetical protein